MSMKINGVDPKTQPFDSEDGRPCTKWAWRLDNDRALVQWAIGQPPMPGDADEALGKVQEWLANNPDRSVVPWEQPEPEKPKPPKKKRNTDKKATKKKAKKKTGKGKRDAGKKDLQVQP